VAIYVAKKPGLAGGSEIDLCALFADNGRLVWYRSHNFGTTERLKRGVPGILDTKGGWNHSPGNYNVDITQLI
jgi:hypothetical protein